ncbi:MAG: PAS domain-containing protein [Deltaproteobacteria bacterium]|nr:MAG: PAS domain-containing protein [Deltaproteobacteria bacterium]
MLDEPPRYEMLDTVRDGVWLVDRDRTIRWWSKGAERISGSSAAEVVGRRCNANIPMHVDEGGRALCRSGCPLVAGMKADAPGDAQVFLHHKEGHRVPVDVRVVPIRDEEGRVTGAAETFRDGSACAAE